ncbi:hypothetical protein AB835_08295 [Candidatus Endobugula sertula]|uniref:Uncharacterized protein n=1 Tax=Candidatus Endobugula sertula TaxID=62101 RepID=A0A1D2QPW3_9GAMM|nr:hypothetical protein AB835_08295 [Candidatus Endobugula sertula]
MSYQEQVERGVELLALCQQLQSEKDGVDRPAVGSIDKSKVLDDFAMDISQAITWHNTLLKLVPLMQGLSQLGRKLEEDGRINPQIGDDYKRYVGQLESFKQSGLQCDDHDIDWNRGDSNV